MLKFLAIGLLSLAMVHAMGKKQMGRASIETGGMSMEMGGASMETSEQSMEMGKPSMEMGGEASKEEVDKVTKLLDLGDIGENLKGMIVELQESYMNKNNDTEDTGLPPTEGLIKRLLAIRHMIGKLGVQLDDLGEKFKLAVSEKDEQMQAVIKAKVKALFERRRALVQFRQNVLQLVKSVADDFKAMHAKWDEETRKDNEEVAEALSELHEALTRENVTAEIFEENVVEARDLFLEEFEKRVACNAVPQTNSLVSVALDLKNKARSNYDCIGRVKSNAKTVKSAIKSFHTTTNIVKKVSSSLNVMHTLLIPLSRLPYVGTVCSAFKTVIGRMKSPAQTAKNNMEKYDRKMYPTWYNRMGSIVTKCTKCQKQCKIVEKKAETTYNYMSAVRDCMCAMNPTSTRTNAISQSESFSGQVQPPTSRVVGLFGIVGDTCSAYDSFLNTLKQGLGLNILDSILNTLNGLYNKLRPLFDVFGEIDIALNRKLCIPNPIELSREALEDSKEWAAERAREAARWVTSWRRKRSLDPFIEKATARDFLSSLNRERRASNICFSIQDIINGISSVFSALLGWAENILNAIISKIPGINSLPGLPSFNFNWNFLEVGWPNFDFNLLDFDFNLSYNLEFLSFTLPKFGLSLPQLNINLPNFADINFNLNWNVPTISLPNHVCQPLGK